MVAQITIKKPPVGRFYKFFYLLLFYDTISIYENNQKSLHKQMSFVPQEAVLFNRTVMENGRIVEYGSHKQLLRRGGLYKKLWSMQTNGFINE